MDDWSISWASGAGRCSSLMPCAASPSSLSLASSRQSTTAVMPSAFSFGMSRLWKAPPMARSSVIHEKFRRVGANSATRANPLRTKRSASSIRRARGERGVSSAGKPSNVDTRRLEDLILNVLLRGDGSRGRIAHRGGDLSGQLRSHVAGRVQARYTGLHAIVRPEEPLFVVVEMLGEESAV